MGKPSGFIEFGRQGLERRSVSERTRDYGEYHHRWVEGQAEEQGSRCMDCSVPFCHEACPLGNVIPEFNHEVYRGNWHNALKILSSTNNFPEFTGRVCPAPCEGSCVLGINADPVTIEYIEEEIVERGFENGWIKPEPPSQRTGKKVAVVGSGPSGLAAAQQLNRAGHLVTVFERADYIGGLLTLGIPSFKLEKDVVKRRVDLMAEEGITFCTGVNVGVNYSVDDLVEKFDAVCLTGGSTHARDLPIPGRALNGIHLAMEYLPQQNQALAGETFDTSQRITAEGKRVIILGGGDTGADCLGTAHRQGAEIIYQYELLPEPPKERTANNPWPQWPQVLRTSGAHEEGGIRDYNILTKSFTGDDGSVQKLNAVRVNWNMGPDGRYQMEEIPGSEFTVEADLVLLALGFLHPEHEGMLEQLGVELDDKGNVKVDANRMTSTSGIFAGGDMVRGQSLVVWAIAEGREVAKGVDQYLMDHTRLPKSIAIR